MVMMKMALVVSAALAMAACAPVEEVGEAADASATATLKDASGKAVGTAELTQIGTTTILTIKAKGLSPGNHGFHLHMTGRCDGPDFATAGGHWNPTNKKHGRNNPDGHHWGDLPDLVVAQDGTGSLNYSLDGVAITATANAILDDDGTAIVIHASPDDNVTDPSGNSGARIACGVFAGA